MSSNSSASSLQTWPMVRVWRGEAVRAGSAAMSTVDVGQPVLADLQLVTVGEPGLVHALAVDIGAVQAVEVAHVGAVCLPFQERVLAGDGDVVEEDVAVGGAADARSLAAHREVLTASASAQPDHQRRALGHGLHHAG